MAARMIRQLADKEPMVVVSLALGTSSLALALVAPRVRYALGMDVEQYYGLEDPSGGPKAILTPTLRRVKYAGEVGTTPSLADE